MFGICCVNWVNVVEGNRRHVRHTSKDSGLSFHIERPFLIINNWSTVAITAIRKGVEVQYL